MCTKPSKEIELNDKIRWIQLKTSTPDGRDSQFVFLKGEKPKILGALSSETFVQDVQKAVDGTIFHLEK